MGSIYRGYMERMSEVCGEVGMVEMAQNVAHNSVSIRRYKASESIRMTAHEKAFIASAAQASGLLVQLT